MFTVTDYRLGSRAPVLRLHSSHGCADLIEIVNYIINCQCNVCSNKCESENLSQDQETRKVQKKTIDFIIRSMITTDIVNQSQTRLINSYMIGNEIEGVMHSTTMHGQLSIIKLSI